MSLLRIYVSVLIILIIVYSIFYTHRKKITKTLTVQVDSLLYLFDKTIYANKDVIFDYHTAKTLLFHNQQEFFTKGKIYTAILPSLLQDIEYVSELVRVSPVDATNLQAVKDTYIAREKIHTLKEYTHTILTILTLGISNLFLP